jgi:hypothetical protein
MAGPVRGMHPAGVGVGWSTSRSAWSRRCWTRPGGAPRALTEVLKLSPHRRRASAGSSAPPAEPKAGTAQGYKCKFREIADDLVTQASGEPPTHGRHFDPG